MKQAIELLSFIVTTLQLSPICRQVTILEVTQFSERQFTFKVRAGLQDGDVLQIRLYSNHDHMDYAYQILRQDRPIQRWDNKEHFSHLASYPHHHHTPDGQVVESALNGTPEHDLLLVLASLRH